ncbi:MAG: LLM class F420-dependent oxidoreductase, partial [Actinomycetota bacterium]
DDIRKFAEFKGWPEGTLDLMLPMITHGGPDEVGEQIRDMIDAGLDGVTINLVANGHNPEMVELAGTTLDAAIG